VSRPASAADDGGDFGDVGLGNCRCGRPAIVMVGTAPALLPVCIRCFGGLLSLARELGESARAHGLDVRLSVCLLIGGRQ
jgi:hypothetical protein